MSTYTGTMTPQEFWDAIERSGFDMTLCQGCNKPVIVIPDGMSMDCEQCSEKAKP